MLWGDSTGVMKNKTARQKQSSNEQHDMKRQRQTTPTAFNGRMLRGCEAQRSQAQALKPALRIAPACGQKGKGEELEPTIRT